MYSVLSATAKMLEHLQAGTRLTPWRVPSQLVRMWDGDGGEKIYQYVKDISCSALHRFPTFFHNELYGIRYRYSRYSTLNIGSSYVNSQINPRHTKYLRLREIVVERWCQRHFNWLWTQVPGSPDTQSSGVTHMIREKSNYSERSRILGWDG